ncbi:MAG: DUF4333 domain-containing protein [Actinomycetota bacterium]|nr:DUF4333 domain-containing protein [Actinomycetota bacterium]MDH5223212.1 DUF4333 domain-containing protein [Actinomycetota bacterium]
MSMRSRSLRLAGIAVLAIAVAACTKTLDTDGLEGMLKTDIADQVQAVITAVDCPADVEVETGATFECTAEEESGTTFTIQVTQSDDQGNVEWEVVDASA